MKIFSVINFSLLKFTLPQELFLERDNDYPSTVDNSTTAEDNFTNFLNNSELYQEFERVFKESIDVDLPGINCTPSFIDEFPPDVFTQAERRRGYVIIHCMICLYVFYAFAIVCGDYFVPSVEHFSRDLKLESDIAGATIMGIATSSPELFTSVVGTFIMRGDIGVGTVVGSAVFNHLAVCAFIGFGCGRVVALDWWPVTRDVVFYAISVIVLFLILLDCKIYWYESSLLLFLYGLYIYGMYNDAVLHAWTEALLKWEPAYSISCQGRRKRYRITQERRKSRIFGVNKATSDSSATIVTISNGKAFTIGDDFSNENETLSDSHCLAWIQRTLAWPIRAIMSVTIPECRNETDGRNQIYGLTFIMSTFWIALLSYVAAWMMTIVGKDACLISLLLKPLWLQYVN